MATPPPARGRPPAGTAFHLPELVLLRSWAEARGLVMEIVLNEVRAGEEYEELVLLGRCRGGPPDLILWRSPEMVVLERGAGQVTRFRFLSEALDHVRLSDVGRL